MEEDNPEELIAKTDLLNIKNLYRLLVFLRNIYPIGYSFEGLIKKLNIKILTESQLEHVVKSGLIDKRNLNLPDKLKETLNPNFLKFFPEYVITSKGMGFISSIETQKLNEKIGRLTEILVIFGIITMFLMGYQLIFQILQYF